MLTMFLRAVILFFLAVLAMRVMGKREVGQLQPFELVVILIISEMASLCMQSSTTPLLYSVTPIVTISLLQILFSYANLKSEKLRAFLCGRPEILIQQGHFRQDVMARLRLNLNDLEEMCRAKGFFDMSAIDYAIMETNGSLSVLPRSDKRPLQVDDLLEQPPQEVFSRLLILDGHVNRQALQEGGYDERWLEKQLHQQGINSFCQTFVAGISEDGCFFAQAKYPSAGSRPGRP